MVTLSQNVKLGSKVKVKRAGKCAPNLSTWQGPSWIPEISLTSAPKLAHQMLDPIRLGDQPRFQALGTEFKILRMPRKIWMDEQIFARQHACHTSARINSPIHCIIELTEKVAIICDWKWKNASFPQHIKDLLWLEMKKWYLSICSKHIFHTLKI